VAVMALGLVDHRVVCALGVASSSIDSRPGFGEIGEKGTVSQKQGMTEDSFPSGASR
jgi:hypothetical protein